MDISAGVGIAHGHRVVDQYKFDLELLTLGSLPDFPGLEAVVGKDNWRPTGPDVESEADGIVLHRLIGRRALDFGQSFGRFERVFLDRRNAVGIGGLGRDFAPRKDDLFLCLFWFRFRGENVATKHGKPNQARHDQKDGHIEHRLRFSGHVHLLSSHS